MFSLSNVTTLKLRLRTSAHLVDHFVKVSHRLSPYPYYLSYFDVIGLFKMFSRWFFANNKLVITFRTSKFGDET